jgi:hypothetical protein
MNRWRVAEDRGSKETDGCPLTDMTTRQRIRNATVSKQK